MATEIERKFLISNEGWRALAEGVLYRQGYLSTDKERTVRVRTVGSKGFLTIKGITVGMSRTEFEYEIPVDEANAMLDALCQQPIIEKRRYKIPLDGLVWEVDEFSGVNAGLIVAEVELDSEDQQFTKPDWIGTEVSGDFRYYNANLIAAPFSTW
ncbi:CYTH domain-containing protein [Magnetospira thiophila]